MDISSFYQYKNGKVSFLREDASRFAKGVANDFNPIHDIDARRFCVPGDLLFAATLDLCGVNAEMEFDFQAMVDESLQMQIAERNESIEWLGVQDKIFLKVAKSGEHCADQTAVQQLVDAYVKFSGQTFPYVLVELMRKENIMINPSRPLVMYRSMALSLTRLDFSAVHLEFKGASFEGGGKKGEVTLNFDLLDDHRKFGTGNKMMLLGGLRPYEQTLIDDLVSEYNQVRDAYL